MTEHAREVLRDCERALADFRSAANTNYWRTRWVALVTLLRAVGHVLDKVDRKSETALSAAITAAWSDLQTRDASYAIFHDFIDSERNNVLKSYEFGMHLTITMRLGTITLNRDTGEETTTPSGETTYEYFFRNGFPGDDPIALCEKAIAFWHWYLDRIDASVSEGQKPRNANRRKL